jgi:hypothetical protein
MDGGKIPAVKKKEEKHEHDLQWELEHWFTDAEFQSWDDKESDPLQQWKLLQSDFPRLAMLSRRFLCAMPTSAPSERVWSRFGHVVSKLSSTIDSDIAAQIMFMRYNFDFVKQVEAFHP